MADNFVQVSPDSTGKQFQTFSNPIGGNTVHAEAVVLVNSLNGAAIQTLAVSGPLTDAQLRAQAVRVSGGVEATSGNSANFAATVDQGTLPWYITSILSTSTVNSPNASNFLATVSGTVAATQSGTWNVGTLSAGTVTANQSNASNFLAMVTGTVTSVQSNASNFLTTVSGTVSANTNLSQIAGTTADTNSGSKSAGTLRVVLATDQPALTNKLLVTPDANSSFNETQILGTTIDVNSGNKSAGTQRVILATDQPNVPVTVQGTASLSANSSFNLSQIVGTTADTNSGNKSAGTLRMVLATDQPALTNKLLVTPDSNVAYNLAQVSGTATAVNSGTLTAGTQRVVIATDQPALTNKLLVTPDSNVAMDLARVQGQASVASVAGVLDVMPRKRTASTGLSPSYISGRINTSTTTTLVATTCYLSSLHMTCTNAGTTWAMKVQDGQATARTLIPNFVLNANFALDGLLSSNPIYLSYAEPIICTTGINVVTVGGTTGNVDYFATYWQ